MDLKAQILERLDLESFYRQELPGLTNGRGDEVQALCPFHEDTAPSLSINLKSGVFYCHGCQAKGDVFNFFEKRHGCDFKGALAGLAQFAGVEEPPQSSHKPKPRGKIVATYDYLGLNGEMGFQVCRIEPGKNGKKKDFSQRRPDGKGGFIWKMTGVKLIPYRLPEVLKAKTVFVVEGEKDADNLAALGLVATTNAGGAGKWRKDYNPHFQGKDVVILPDNDDPGRAHAQDIARNLHGVAASVKVVELPGLPEKGDVSDWLKAGGTIDQLREIVNSTPDWEPPKEPVTQAPTVEPTPTISGPPTWPAEIMAGAAGTFAKTYSAYLETPESFLFMDYLTALGHVISDSLTLRSEINPEPRLYTINLGESADTRKSTSLNKVCRFFSDTLIPEAMHEVLGVGSAEGLQRAFKRNSRVLLVSDELNALVQKMRIDASVLSPCICTLFDSNRFHSLTKKHEINIDDAQLCILGASTLDTYRGMFTSQFLDIGLINRLFVVIGDSQRKFAIPQPIPESEKQALKQDLINVLSFVESRSQGSRFTLEINSTARDIFEAWYFGLEQSVFVKRLDTYGHRLMPLLAVNEKLDIITPEIAEKTVALLDYELAARKYADPIDADNAIAKIEERIRRLLAGGPIRKRDLERAANKNRVGTSLWNTAIKNLLPEELNYNHSQKIYSLR